MRVQPLLLMSFFALGCTTPEAAVSETPSSEVTPTRAPPKSLRQTPPTDPQARAVEREASAESLPPNPDGLEWSLTVEPATFALSDLGRVRILLTARNKSAETIAPFDFRPYDLRVDDESSMALSLAFGNGLVGPRWSSLPAGQSATDERVGVAFVEAAGTFSVSAHRGDEELARTTVTVRRP